MSPAEGRAGASPDRDAYVVDAIATLLGTSPEWRSAAGYLEMIADLIGTVRPHPGDHAPGAYPSCLEAATGRQPVRRYASES